MVEKVHLRFIKNIENISSMMDLYETPETGVVIIKAEGMLCDSNVDTGGTTIYYGNIFTDEEVPLF